MLAVRRTDFNEKDHATDESGPGKDNSQALDKRLNKQLLIVEQQVDEGGYVLDGDAAILVDVGSIDIDVSNTA